MDKTTPVELDRVRHDLPVTADEIAAYLSISTEGLSKLIKEDPTFPCHRLGNGPKAHRRFFRSEVDTWLRSRWSLRASSGKDVA